MADEITLFIQDDGIIEGLYTDEIDLRELGEMQIKRASSVEFDAERGLWVARDAETGERLYDDIAGRWVEHKNRTTCIAYEVEYFNRRLEAGLRPFTERADG